MIWIPFLLIGLFYDVGNVGLIKEYKRGKPNLPIQLPLVFYVLSIICAVWFTSRGPEWIGVCAGAISLLVHHRLLRFWKHGDVVLKRERWMKRRDDEPEADYLARLKAEEKRDDGEDSLKIRAPWL